MSVSGTPETLLPCPICSEKNFHFADHLALSCEAMKRSRIMFVPFEAHSPTIGVRFLPVSRKESKRSPRCDSQVYMWRPSEVTAQPACLSSGWGRPCFVSSESLLPKAKFL